MWRVLWSALLFLVLTLGRSSLGFADERKEVHVSIRPHGIPPDMPKWAFSRGTKTRILSVEQDFDKVTEGLTVFVYDPKAPSENNCILKTFMDERHETEREDIHIPPEWRERCSGGGGSGSPKGAGASASRALAQVGAVANLSSPEGEKGGSPYGVAGGMNPKAESSPGLQAAVATVQIALSASEMKQMVERATRFVVARLTKQAEIEAVEKATFEAIEQLGKEGKAVSREAIENRAREAAAEAERAIRRSGGGGAGSAAANGVKTVHIPGPRKPPPLGASGTPIRTNGETAVTKAGRQAHADWNPGQGFKREERLPSGNRPDAINWKTRTVKELKPDNPRAIQRGEKQVERYRKELEEMTGKPWTGTVETYKKP